MRSRLMLDTKSEADSRLLFGSAVVPKVEKNTGKTEHGFIFKYLLGFHKLYSKLLLNAAKYKLDKLISK